MTNESFYDLHMFDNDSNYEGSSEDWMPHIVVESCSGGLDHDFQKIFVPVVFGIIFTLGIVGNGLVVLVMGYQKKAKKTMTDKYRLHLSVADLLFVLTLPFWAVDVASNWYFGGFLCVAVHMIHTVNLYSSVLILAFISLDRYLAVVRATNSMPLRKLLSEKVIYLGVWLPAALLTVPDMVFAKVHDTGSKLICQRNYPAATQEIWMAAFHFQHILVGFLLPGFIILTCYCIIICRLSQGSKVQQKRKALKTTVILILCFYICWLPYCLGIFMDILVLLGAVPYSCDLSKAIKKWIFFTESLAYFHCCLNPILYAFMGVTFKKSACSTLSPSRGSSRKMLPKKRGVMSSVSESESSSFHSS